MSENTVQYIAGKDVSARLTSNPDIVEIDGVYYQVVSRQGDVYTVRGLGVNSDKQLVVQIPEEYIRKQEETARKIEAAARAGGEGFEEMAKTGRYVVWEEGVPKIYYATPLGFAEYIGRGETEKYQVVGGGEIHRVPAWDPERGTATAWLTEKDLAKLERGVDDYLSSVNALEVQVNPVFNTVPERFFKEGDKWYTFVYNPETNQYNMLEVPTEKIRQYVFDKRLGLPTLNVSGYNIQDIGKIARQESSTFTFIGIEDAVRQYKLKETFPELQKKGWITEADVQHVISARLEKYGWRPDTLEKYDTLRALTRATLQNPDVWKAVEEDINRQLEEARPRIEELQRFYEVKALKQWDAERMVEAEKQLSQFYKSASESTPTWAVPLSSFINNMARFLSFGFVNPPASGYEAVLTRYEQLAAKAPAPGMMLPSARIREGLEAGVYTPLEQAEIKAIEKNLDQGKTLLYTAGYAAAFFASSEVLGKVLPEAVRFAKWEFTSNEALIGKTLNKAGIELKTPEFLSNISEAVKAKALNIGEKIGLVEKVQYVPTEVDLELARIQRPGSEAIVSKVEFTKWARAEEVLGKTVPESMRLQPGEVSTLPVKLGEKTVNVPVVSGEFGVVGGEKIALVKEGVKLEKPFLVYGKGTGEESFFFARLSKETRELTAPRYDFLKAVDAKISYQKVFEQAMGGTPKAVLYTEEMEKALGFSRTPRIPVMEKYVSNVRDFVTPLRLPLYMHPQSVRPGSFDMEEFDRERRDGGPAWEPKIPLIERFEPDIGIKPAPVSKTSPPGFFQPVSLRMGDITAVALRVGEIAAPRIGQALQPRLDVKVEPRIGDIAVTVPKLEPKLDIPPQSIPDHPPPPPRTLPRLPLPPPISIGSRDLPVYSPARLWARKEWLVQWFGPGAVKTRKGGRRRRGGRK